MVFLRPSCPAPHYRMNSHSWVKTKGLGGGKNLFLESCTRPEQSFLWLNILQVPFIHDHSQKPEMLRDFKPLVAIDLCQASSVATVGVALLRRGLWHW